jgi:hypothetical protein
MKTLIGEELHHVVYIEYKKNVPFQAATIHYIPTADKPYWRLYWWDCFLNDNDKKDLRFYNSGSGGCEKDIQAPQWVDGFLGKYWLAKGYKLKGKAKNGIRLEKPLRVKSYFKSSINPFKVGEEAYSMEWCEKCDCNSVDWCQKHKYEDNEGTLRYKDDDSYAE